MKTKVSKTTTYRLIFLIIGLIYNLLLGIYLKDFLVLSPTLLSLYLLSALPILFLAVEVKSKTMRVLIYILLALIVSINGVYAACCRRVFPFLAIISIGVVLFYFIVFLEKSGKDKPLTKIYIMIISALIISMLFSAYDFVYKQDNVSLTNGQATLWDTQTEQLADEICEDCDTDADKVNAIYDWIIHNFEYDYEYNPLTQYFNVRKTLSTRKGVCYDFSHLFAAICRSQNISCYVVDGIPYDPSKDNHTWNRVYFDNTWWNLDVTNDITQIKNHGQLYGFRCIENAFVIDDACCITRMY